METITIFQLNYLNGTSILVTEREEIYSLHVNTGTDIERWDIDKRDGAAEKRLAALLIAVERFHLYIESEKRGVDAEELRWDDRYIRLTQFIEYLSPGYLFRWEYVRKVRDERKGTHWTSYIEAYQIHCNRLKESHPVFEVHHDRGEGDEVHQWIEWVVSRDELIEKNPQMSAAIEELVNREFLFYRQEIVETAPKLFDGFSEIIDE